MKQNDKIKNLFCLLISLLSIHSSYAQYTCGTRMKKSDRAERAAIMETGRQSPRMYRFMIKHHIFKLPDGTTSMSSSDIKNIMRQVNDNFFTSNIQLNDCGSVEVISIPRSDQMLDEKKYRPIMRKSNTDIAIDIYWAFDVVVYDSELHPVSIGGVCVDEDAIFMNYPNLVKENNNVIAATTHELGHYFGLEHTFGDLEDWESPPDEDGKGTYELVTREEGKRNCEIEGDGFCDTPADPNRFSGCSISSKWKDPNGDSYKPDPDNFMTYSSCQSRFSYEQRVYMNGYAKTTHYELTQYGTSLSSNLNNVTKTYYEASIKADNDITGKSDVKYKAQSEVRLKDGFFAAKGVKFNARIEVDCDNLKIPSKANAPDEEKGSNYLQSNFMVSPNPFSSTINVAFLLSEDATTYLSIHNIFGQEILKLDNEQMKAGDYEKQYNVASLPTGIYFLIFKSGTKTETLKLIKAE